MRVKPGFFLFFLSLVCGGVKAQSITSTYTSSGIGELSSQGLQQNFSMGELGYAVPHSFYINTQNPSMLNYNGLSSFAVGLMGDFRKYQTETLEESANTVSLRYLAMSFPLVRSKWTTAVTLLPFSSVNYNSYTLDSLNVESGVVSQYQGNGGLSSLSWMHGLRLYKSLSVGLKASFIFGTINKTSRTQLLGEDFANAYVISYVENTFYKDINFSFSFSNKFKLGTNNQFINIGGVYNMSGDLQGERERLYERLLTSGGRVQSGTLSMEDVNFTIPRSFGFGVTYEKFNKFIFGSDIELQQWNGAGGEGDDRFLDNTLSVSVGGEITPDIQSVSSYLKRSTYRFGLQLKELPYRVEGTQINDFGINFGISLPVSGYSSLEAAVKYGVRGITETDSNLVRESYIQAVIGATINDRWFVKRRYD